MMYHMEKQGGKEIMWESDECYPWRAGLNRFGAGKHRLFAL